MSEKAPLCLRVQHLTYKSEASSEAVESSCIPGVDLPYRQEYLVASWSLAAQMLAAVSARCARRGVGLAKQAASLVEGKYHIL